MAEIPIALIVVAFILILVTRTSSTAGFVQRNAHQGNQATAFGAAKLDELAALPPSQIRDGTDSLTARDGSGFRRTWTVADRPPCKEVSVVVRWRSRGRDETLTMATLLR